MAYKEIYKHKERASGGILAVLPMIFHLGAGLGMIYYLLTTFVNYTDIYSTDRDLTISSKHLKAYWTRGITILMRLQVSHCYMLQNCPKVK